MHSTSAVFSAMGFKKGAAFQKKHFQPHPHRGEKSSTPDGSSYGLLP
jgi:hypothetical protein